MSRHLIAKTIGRKVIELQDVGSSTSDQIDFPDRIIKWEIGYEHVVVATTSQVHVYNERYRNTPLSIIDGRTDVRVLIMAKKYKNLTHQFILIEISRSMSYFWIFQAFPDCGQ